MSADFDPSIEMSDQDQRVHWDISEQIIGSAFTVLNELGPGLDEKIYENALIIEFTERGLHTDQQHQFPVRYRGRLIGKLVPDLIVEDAVVVDTKVVESFVDTHVAKLLGYLKISKLRLGFLINFKYATLDWKRIVRTRDAERKLTRRPTSVSKTARENEL